MAQVEKMARGWNGTKREADPEADAEAGGNIPCATITDDSERKPSNVNNHASSQPKMRTKRKTARALNDGSR